jgi:hypothetical protein
MMCMNPSLRADNSWYTAVYPLRSSFMPMQMANVLVPAIPCISLWSLFSKLLRLISAAWL